MPATPEKTALDRMHNRTQLQGTPVPTFELEPLPAELVTRFPSMGTWHTEQNRRFKEYNQKLNETLKAGVAKRYY